MNIENKSEIKEALTRSYSINSSISFADLFKKTLHDLNTWKPLSVNDEGLIDVIDFFSGCGGMSLGFSVLSQRYKFFDLKGGVDINNIALGAYEKNFNAPTINQDIRELCTNEKIKEIKQKFKIDSSKKPLIVIGCAPCQGFTAHRKKNWHKEDSRNTLVGYFADIASRFDPDFIVMENVPEILGKKYWAHYEEARDILSSKGYNIKQTIYNSASFGVPQARYRAIIIASKHNFSLPLPIFKEEDFKTVRDAIGSLPIVKAGEVSSVDNYHRSANHKGSTIDTIKQIPIDGGSRPSGIGPNCLDKVKGFSDVYGRLSWDKPSITLTQYSRNPASGRFTHPEQNRGLTIREAARIQSFPDSFHFNGSLDNNFKQIGEAVPPALSTAIATQILIDLSGIHQNDNKAVKSILEPVISSYSSETMNIQDEELVI